MDGRGLLLPRPGGGGGEGELRTDCYGAMLNGPL
jgi:hypothetical protein